ncbi:hypothetical protein [Ferruginibacter albus]|uniref:hypothetical protein n=1 Tax=Ferruginibacter albus TaxID=2875540 RepID=UPI001CC359EE|nr:hypothetical protein [Ferruginibacter albus]UAY51687.1 hypothetical protein K9M53_13960 [Ferruginibacter albus]
MRKLTIIAVCVSLVMTSCSVFHKDQYGCPSNGRNVGAEKIASGDPKAIKASQKAKFKGAQSF